MLMSSSSNTVIKLPKLLTGKSLVTAIARSEDESHCRYTPQVVCHRTHPIAF